MATASFCQHAAHRPVTQFPALLVSAPVNGGDRLASLLLNMHCEVRVAASCRQASALFLQEDIPVILCDEQLPDGDWRTLLEESQRLRHPPAIIVVSGAADAQLWAAVLNAGGHDVLTRPWSAEAATWMVQSAWRRWQRMREVDSARSSNALATRLS